MTDLIGSTLGQYRIVEQIGEGGMATVYKAYQPSLNRYVALKILAPIHARQSGFNERFQREAEAIANLSHPNILPVYDSGQEEGYSYIAMRYVEGARTLKEVMTDSLDLARVADLIGQVAAALDYAHRKGVIHRDVKPSNVMVDDEWALLTDFGLAKMVEGSVQLTASGAYVGTPEYMSPEQGRGLDVDCRTDIYSLGVTLFEMLTGQIPHNAETPFAIVLKRMSEPLPLPREINPDIPESVERVILKALAQDPDHRYDTAGGMAEDLRQALEDSRQLPAIETELEQHEFVDGISSTPLDEQVKWHPDRAGRETGIVQKITQVFLGDVDAERARRDQRNRQTMLERVRTFWVKGVLEQSLHHITRIELSLEEQPNAVERPWDLIVQRPNDMPQSLPPGIRIGEVFDKLGGTLLILGGPGTGKTTMLLELANELLDRAEQDLSHPIPAVFNLSTWATKRRPLAEWLVDELKERYYVPRKVGQAWVDGDQILPLLDGLDEVVAAHREGCVEAINAYREGHGMISMAVCSRSEEYGIQASQLQLGGAVVIQALGHVQVDAYLARAGDALAGVRAALAADGTLYEVFETPLMLSVAAVAYRDRPTEEVSAAGTVTERWERLSAEYVEAMFQRRRADSRYTLEQTRHWLAWLAWQMVAHDRTVFYLEEMQPDWLPTRRGRWTVTRGLAIVVGLVSGLVFGLASGWVNGLIGVLVGGLSAYSKELKPAETLHWSGSGLKAGLKAALVLGLVGGLVCGVLGCLFALLTVEAPGAGSAGCLLGGLVGGLFIGPISIGLFGGYYGKLILSSESGTRTQPNRGIPRSARNGLVVGLGSGLIYGLVDGLIFGPIFGLTGGLIVMLGFGLRYGVRAYLQHFILRALLTRNNLAPWRYVDFLEYAKERVFLRRVGGGYIFIHRLLMEHFAAQWEVNR